tara:strand:+ start:1759 stop:2232 length:474 start_codon:yes stop_codon:yes gene_type:complete
MMEIAAAISLASSAFNALKKGMETGREIEDMVDYFGKWFEAKDALSEQNINANNQPMLKKMFSGNSVEAQALQVTHAKHKIKQMEKELYEYLLYTGQQEFYNDMMAERRAIRQARIDEAIRRSERKRFWIDVTAVVLGLATVTGVIVGVISLISSAG